ncbi:MAG: sulfotransferase domain-containing protein [Hyphomonadaceae bacterium]|nr:sulfotransferase domain-containing protein [Hyphomonadaceae bacterium]
MIVWVYGQQKSASSFCFQLVCDVLEAAGYEQRERRAAYLEGVSGAMTTGLRSTRAENIDQLLAKIGADEAPIAIKTHGNLTPKIKAQFRAKQAVGFATFRDPRDAALSLYEHGQRNREKGIEGKFGEAETLTMAVEHMAKSLPRIEAWTNQGRVKPISYTRLSEEPLEAVRTIARHLKLKVPVRKIVAAYQQGEKEIGNFNVGQKGRFDEIATPEEKAAAEAAFGDFTLPEDVPVKAAEDIATAEDAEA